MAKNCINSSSYVRNTLNLSSISPSEIRKFEKFAKMEQTLLPQLLNRLLIVFEKFGLWPPAKRTIRHFFQPICLVFVPLISYLCILTTSILFVDSIELKINSLLISFSTVAVLAKATILYYKHSELIEMVDLTSVLGSEVHRDNENEMKIIKSAFKSGQLLFYSYCVCFTSSWLFWACQSIFMGDETLIWSSREAYPPIMGRNRYVFSSMLLFQALAAAIDVALEVLSDVFCITVNMIFAAYLDVLAERLCRIGSTRDGLSLSGSSRECFDGTHDETDYLKECIQMHKTCLR